MRSIAELLAALPNDESRARVLRWSADHFHGARPKSPTAPDDRQRPAATTGGGQADPALTIGEEVFDAPRRAAAPAQEEDEFVDDRADDETIHCDDLSVDEAVFEDVEDVEDVEEIDDEDLTLALGEVQPVAAEARPLQGGLESMLRDFVADFQRLALEWQTA